MKRFFLLIGMVFVAMVFIAVNTNYSIAQGQSNGRHDEQYLAFGSSSIGGNYYICAGGIASVVKKNFPWIKINAEVTGGVHGNLLLLGNKKIHLALATNDETSYAYNGKEKFKEKMSNIRGVLGGHMAVWQMYTLKKTGIKSIADLKGKRVSLGSMGSVGNRIGEVILNAYGLKMKKDWTPEYVGHAEGADALRDGRVDAVLIMTSAPVSAIIDISSSYGSDVVFLSPDKEKMQVVMKENPYWFETKIPANTYKGQVNDVSTFAHSTILLCDASVNDETVYSITKSILENNKYLVEVHPSFKEWTPENATRGIKGVVPFHPGAEKYLREKGLL